MKYLVGQSQKYKRHQEILGPHKLLQKVYQRFCSSSKAYKHTDKKRCKVVVESRTAESIQRTQKGVHNETSISSTGLR